MSTIVVQSRTESGVVITTLDGPLNAVTAPVVNRAFIGLANQGHFKHIVDLNQLDSLDRDGMAPLIALQKRVAANDGWVRLVCSQPAILQVLRANAFDRILPVFNSVADAMPK